MKRHLHRESPIINKSAVRREGKLSLEFHHVELLKCPTAGYIQPTAQMLAPAWIMIWEFCTRCRTPASFPLSRVINSILLSLLSAVCIFYIQNYWSSYSYEAAHRTGHILRYTTSLNLQPEYHLQKVKNPTAIPAKKILWLKELSNACLNQYLKNSLCRTDLIGVLQWCLLSRKHPMGTSYYMDSNTACHIFTSVFNVHTRNCPLNLQTNFMLIILITLCEKTR